jgi:hypothetical protein
MCPAGIKPGFPGRLAHSRYHTDFFPQLALQVPWALASDFQFHDHFTGGRNFWTSDQLVARKFNITYSLFKATVSCADI